MGRVGWGGVACNWLAALSGQVSGRASAKARCRPWCTGAFAGAWAGVYSGRSVVGTWRSSIRPAASVRREWTDRPQARPGWAPPDVGRGTSRRPWTGIGNSWRGVVGCSLPSRLLLHWTGRRAQLAPLAVSTRRAPRPRARHAVGGSGGGAMEHGHATDGAFVRGRARRSRRRRDAVWRSQRAIWIACWHTPPAETRSRADRSGARRDDAGTRCGGAHTRTR